MRFVHCARWARCRNAAISPWARAVNASLRLDGQRGLAAVATRVCAERRPLAGFPEQRIATMGGMTVGLAVGETAVSESDSLAAIIESIINLSEGERCIVELEKICVRWDCPSLAQCYRSSHDFDTR
eukprot:gnl/TRDRNA2_/TRDRNA2_183863_c0_seq1.p1 gnl/TRDRNA2_/TRDRNA2_183863_c0~~gnl/TRDRNA2_/TRDRNA2_183863_c0_seq1.p1  ORF type:complete len:127 (+),score=11.97 gnl/TRDRNA2_/TRDRNA2_183863_c0_seq1:74-454(+)